MADDPRQYSTAELANVFTQAARSSNREYISHQRRMAGIDDFELPPAQAMLSRSPIVNYAKQVLPHQLGDTGLGGWVANQLDKAASAYPELRPELNRTKALAKRIPLGGWDQQQRDTFAQARIEDPLVRRTTVEAGVVPTPDNLGDVRAKGDIGANLAQAAGVTAGDVASDGLRNIWWFINAPQALTNLMTDEAIQSEGRKILGPNPNSKTKELRNEPIIKNRGTRMAATLPAVLATSFGIGNVMREEGYKAVLPSAEDPRQSENALAEVGARYFLGRTGGLLPYDEFVKERPDVSKEEYYKYKTYLHNKNLDLNPLDGDFNIGGVVKGTVDGIHGPEVSFLGKSIPALTGMVPIAAAIGGARRGMRRAKDQLRNSKDGDMIAKADQLRSERNDARKTFMREGEMIDKYDKTSGDPRPVRSISKEKMNYIEQDYQDAQQAVERVVLENALMGGGAGALGGGLGATAIESVIRSLKPAVPVAQEEV